MRDLRHDEVAFPLNDRAVGEARSSRDRDRVRHDAAGESRTRADLHVVPDDAVSHARPWVDVRSGAYLQRWDAFGTANREGGAQIIGGRPYVPEVPARKECADTAGSFRN